MQKLINIAIIVGAVVALIIIAIVVAGFLTGSMLAVVYFSLIVVALFTLAITVLQIYAIVALVSTISTVRNEMKPLLASVQETVGVAKDTVDAVQEMAKSAGQTATAIGATARFTSDFAIGPSVRVAAMLVAAQQMLRVFLGRGHTGTRADQRRKQQMDAAVGGE